MNLAWEEGTTPQIPAKSTNGLYVIRIVVGGSRGPMYLGYFRPDIIHHHMHACTGEIRGTIEEAKADCEADFEKLQAAA